MTPLIAGLPLHPLAGTTRSWAFVRSAAKAYGPDLRLAVLTGDPVTVDLVRGRQRLGPGWVSLLLQRALVRLRTARTVGPEAVAASYTRRREALLEALARRGITAHGRSGMNVWVPVTDETGAVARREAGQRLLAKHGRGVRLTDAGRLLAGHAARILSQVELAQADLEAQRGQVAGELRISAFPTAARGLFPLALAALREEHPALRVRSRELEPENGIAGVVRGDLDLAVVLDWYNKPLPLPDGLVKAPILDDPADVAVPAGHRLAGRDEVDLAELAEDEWITWGEGEFCHEWLMFTLRSRGVEPVIGHQAAESHTQLALVSAGLGVCIAPMLGRNPLPDGVVTVPLKQRVRRHVLVVWRADADRRPSIRAAVHALQEAGRKAG
ncbi:LysR family transcriptional regulator [Streptomyces thermospinosisporus]|uniref:LysR family transcriptional regulator n=1 Tax=Streptomyces thermospinosisporus TaxID=161482 RepID=A0ABP4JXX6_9ACTN